MAIDAVIRSVAEDGNDLVLTLAPRLQRDTTMSLPGQKTMRIVNATHKPVEGQLMWSTGHFCTIEPSWGVTEKRNYKRIGYTRLIEVGND